MDSLQDDEYNIKGLEDVQIDFDQTDIVFSKMSPTEASRRLLISEGGKLNSIYHQQIEFQNYARIRLSQQPLNILQGIFQVD